MRSLQIALIFPGPLGQIRLDHNIQDVVHKVKADGCPTQRFLQVDVPAHELAFSSPDDMHRIHRAGRNEKESVRPGNDIPELPVAYLQKAKKQVSASGRELPARARAQVKGHPIKRILNNGDGSGRPHLASPDFSIHNLMTSCPARRLTHASKRSGR